MGIHIMSQAGYDPNEAPKFWERFSSAKSGDAPPEFASTHPSDASRAAALRALLPQAVEEYQAAPTKHGVGVPLA